MRDMDLDWFSVGAIVRSLMGERYAFIAGSLGRSDAIGLGDPEPDTYEGFLQARIATWGLSRRGRGRPHAHRHPPAQVYSPADRSTVDTADAVLHVNADPATTTPTPGGR